MRPNPSLEDMQADKDEKGTSTIHVYTCYSSFDVLILRKHESGQSLLPGKILPQMMNNDFR